MRKRVHSSHMNKKQANKGGEFGANGEWYKGGEFINTVAENSKGTAKKAKKPTGKRQVASGIWEVQPTEDAIAIFPQLAGVEMPIWENGKLVGFTFNSNLRGEFATAEATARRQMLIAKFTSGEKWV